MEAVRSICTASMAMANRLSFALVASATIFTRSCAARLSPRHPPPTTPEPTTITAGAAAEEVLLPSDATSNTGMLLSRILSYLNPTRLLLHTASLVCRTWRNAAAPLLADHVSRAILAELGSGSSSSSSSDQLSIDLVQRTPLLAYYGETIADEPLAAKGGGNCWQQLKGSPDRSVPMLKSNTRVI